MLRKNGINVKEFHALWNNTVESQDEPVSLGLNKFGQPYNKLAGINRNKRMVDYIKNSNSIVIALPGGSGTEHMVNYSLFTGLTVYKFDEDSGDFVRMNNIRGKKDDN